MHRCWPACWLDRFVSRIQMFTVKFRSAYRLASKKRAKLWQMQGALSVVYTRLCVTPPSAKHLIARRYIRAAAVADHNSMGLQSSYRRSKFERNGHCLGKYFLFGLNTKSRCTLLLCFFGLHLQAERWFQAIQKR